jgi:hypothetical protein
MVDSGKHFFYIEEEVVIKVKNWKLKQSDKEHPIARVYEGKGKILIAKSRIHWNGVCTIQMVLVIHHFFNLQKEP